MRLYARDGSIPPPEARTDRRFCYPELRITYHDEGNTPPPGRSFARLSKPGRYVTTITRPAMFGDYLAEQIDLLVRDYGVEVDVGLSTQQIPFPYVLDGLDISALDGTPPTELARHFPATELAEIGDEIADGLFISRRQRRSPAGAVRRVAHRFFARAAQTLYRHAARTCAALHPLHQLSPLCR